MIEIKIYLYDYKVKYIYMIKIKIHLYDYKVKYIYMIKIKNMFIWLE